MPLNAALNTNFEIEDYKRELHKSCMLKWVLLLLAILMQALILE